MNRRTPLVARTPLGRGKPLGRHARLETRSTLDRGGPLRQVSAKRARENRERAAMVAGMFPERPLCVVYVLSQHRPGVIPDEVISRCGRWADDVHEPQFRSRLGSAVDPANMVALCRGCHDWVHDHSLDAGELGLAVASWA